MEEFPINIPILYPDFLILAALICPSGLSYSLYVNWRGVPSRITTGMLAFLALPFVVVVPAVQMLRPELMNLYFFTLRGVPWKLIGLAVLLAPLVLLIEYSIQALASYKAEGRFPGAIGRQRFWQKEFSLADHLLLALVAAGEEIFYRLIWIGILMSLGLPAWCALVVSAIAYGLNHLAFGRTSIVSKSVSGLVYGTLYLAGGSIWLPIVTHILQNVFLFRFTTERNA